MSQILISAAHKSSGKTTISLGLCAALRRRGMTVQPFKKGPDYIDPMWLGRAAGHDCHNLDFYTMQREEIRDTLAWFGQSADINIIEGNKGLYDGLDLDGSNSNAALAKLVGAPVVLVLDARGMTRGIAPLILGYQAFDTDINIAGVILNQLGGNRHEAKLRAVIENYTDVPVIGAVARHTDMEIQQRHLGLIPSNEEDAADQHIQSIGTAIERQVDLDKLIALAATSPLPTIPATSPLAIKPLDLPVRLGIARDEAFGFYYPADLDAMTHAGAELVFIDTLRDTELPEIDGLFIGGGFPESCMEKLQANRSLREAIRQAIDNGLPVYAECGGLMYLSRSLTWNDRCCEMVGAVPGDTLMHTRPQGRGYVRLSETDTPLWPACTEGTNEIAAHEFHYSSLENLEPPESWEYDVQRGAGMDGKHDGYRHRNLLACYTHQRSTSKNRWTERFLHFIQAYKTRHN